MDGTTVKGPQIDVQEQLAQIKAHMPETYASIQRKAREIGAAAFALVRRGVRGEVNCFYAMEGGRVTGTPFDRQDLTADVAVLMVQYNPRSIIMWGEIVREAQTDGTA